MDVEKLVSDIKIRFNHHENKLYLQEKYQNQLTIADQGGVWRITPELLGFLRTAGEYEILLDDYKKPCRVHVPSLLNQLTQKYTEIMTAWYAEFQELSKLR